MTEAQMDKSSKNSNGNNTHRSPAQEQGQKQRGRLQRKAQEAAPKVSEEKPHPFIGQELRVVLEDQRVIVGTLIAYLGLGDLLLQDALEERRYADGELNHRQLRLIAIPFKHVTAMHRRRPGNTPIAQVGA
ncbi:hypothetical protein, conserved [Trypanosoma brucei gambiense DAL972]|uniref:LSM domain-containing protein n=2 Tax=Trypanosoma brucei TaxID=5691 RepID=C9ZVW0_TRYB9|nr:hypothetical protein, conserved [Trypanosoma brucei gambiense DAL972]RHW73301.1 hypothetical protein DPX39_040067400 [Trypanosoma brucei equiperdum]CBH13548.1 hypothetical protein, conserved [Trypanosoma brucei gambiense DAL972]|eukprot:XP_011775825.1 hypothetical protein, conserved [Trypanosoma brucei gambiense DAL972]